MSEIQFIQRTIAPAGRNKYGNYMSKGNVTKSVVMTTYAGNDTTTTIGNTGATEDSGVTDFYCMLSQTNATFNAVDLVQGATAATQVIAYRGYEKAITYVCDIDSVTATTADEAITNLVAPDNLGIRNVPAGISVSFVNNGTSASTIIFTADTDLTGNTGTIYIPVCVYKRSDNLPNPDDLYSWYEHQYRVTSANTLEYIGACEVVWLEYVWNVNRNATTSYIMDLSNQMAGVNVSATTPQGDILYPNSIATLTCTATTHMNAELVSGITYSIFTKPMYNARGVAIVNTANTGVLVFTSAGTNSFNFTGPSLPIDVIATLDGETIATKTMTINKNYPGSDGTPAHTRYIVTDYDAVKFNPNTSAFTPSQVVGRVMLQVGDQEPDYDTATTIYQWYNDLETGKTSAQGSITANTYLGVDSITFALKNSSNVYYEIEEVPVMSEGMDGQPGESGATGPSGESAWYLTLSNDNASINCDSEGNILPGAVRPTCQGKLYQGNSRKTNATYTVDWGTASGITSAVSSGILTLTFGSGFDFTGTTLSISISGKSGGEVKDVKIMNVTKAYAGEAGESGESAVSYWLEPSFGEVIYDPNTRTTNPSSISCSAYKQIGQGAVVPAADAEIVYTWQYRSTGGFKPESAYTGAIPITTGDCETYRRLRLILYVGDAQVDQEDIDILANGVSGQTGAQGRAGAAVRGPYYWNEHSASTRCWCAGESGGSCTECDKWIDVIYKDGTYYYCSDTYYGSLYPWDSAKVHWTSGTSFDFIATRVLLAQNASIDFLVGNEFYLRDTNGNITGGGAGGSGITFWAGAENPSDAPFWVDAQGNIFANKGTFAGYVQYPFTNLNSLPKIATAASASDYDVYSADSRAYIIAYPELYTAPGRALVLPPASSSLNGFSYEFIIHPRMTQSENPVDLRVSVSGGADIDCYAFADYQTGEVFVLNSGRFSITCMPSASQGQYKWAIISASGHLEVENTGYPTTYITTLLGISQDTPSMVNKVVTYTGSTKPSVPSTGNTMYVKL